MKKFRIPLAALLLSTLAWSQSNCALVPISYTVTDLGTLDGSASFANGINDSGSVVGNAPIAGATHPFLWTPTTGIQDLGTLGGPLGYAYGINSAGFVVGYSSLPQLTEHGFLWTPAAGLKDLGTIGNVNGFSFAFSIDDHNHIFGNSASQTNLDGGDAAIWVGSTIYDLGTNGGIAAQFDGANARLEAVGFSRAFAPLTSALFWSKTGGFKALPTLFAGDGSEAFTLNNHGMIVGYEYNSTSEYAVVWHQGVANNIGSLGGGAAAAGVNDQCQVVGGSYLSDNVTDHAFIWTPQGGMKDLNNLIPANSGWVLEVAAAINATGQIAGTGLINGLTHAFLLTPVP